MVPGAPVLLERLRSAAFPACTTHRNQRSTYVHYTSHTYHGSTHKPLNRNDIYACDGEGLFNATTSITSDKKTHTHTHTATRGKGNTAVSAR